ncbi:potassium-transporting ATPase subunit F [Arthrobacter flavus]|uniref:Potassium-transporting ATPase subunit F n=1 Tax=Arthrobacter flavus TaxID=95172 RepID=A0ABW4Q4F0_9MICC
MILFDILAISLGLAAVCYLTYALMKPERF